QDYKSGRAHAKFAADLATKDQWEVSAYPTLIFLNEEGEVAVGLNPMNELDLNVMYQDWVRIITEFYPKEYVKENHSLPVLDLLKLYHRMTTRELEIVSGHPRAFIEQELEKGHKLGDIIREKHKHHNYWQYNRTPFRINESGFRIENAAIIGGGVCGYFLSSILHRCGVNSVIYERQESFSTKGFGFLMLENGIEAMNILGLKNEILRKGNAMNYCKSITPKGKLISKIELDNCLAISREDFFEILNSNSEHENVKFKKEFTGIGLDDKNKITSVNFKDGSSVTSDVYFGADGFFSSIRSDIFSDHSLERLDEQEIVCLIRVKDLNIKKDEFIKVIDPEQGKYMGLIPLGDDRYIWFIQFNNATHPLADNNPETIEKYVKNTVNSYPNIMQRVVEETLFEESFIWTSRRMNHLPSYHYDRMVLVGDAAHPLLALTSQGANSALEDAAVLLTLISHQSPDESMDDIFTKFYNLRKEAIEHYIEEGDVLVNEFLSLSKEGQITMPLSLFKDK
ncbi:MAG: FAD-dependent monooxygenase, partial [Crocinitomicaceae bacterium]|nr:FAD-dependent monooxygenase [Crocinitomicaceae bacterium]